MYTQVPPPTYQIYEMFIKTHLSNEILKMELMCTFLLALIGIRNSWFRSEKMTFLFRIGLTLKWKCEDYCNNCDLENVNLQKTIQKQYLRKTEPLRFLLLTIVEKLWFCHLKNLHSYCFYFSQTFFFKFSKIKTTL